MAAEVTKMKKPTIAARMAVASLVAAASLGLWGCPNPNDIGVQQYGIVKATCGQASNGQPVANALVTASSVTAETDSTGVAILNNVPIGQHTITADAPGLHGQSASPVTVTQGATSTVTIQMSPT